MLILLGKGLISWLYSIFVRYLYRRWENWDSQVVTSTQINKRHSGLS